MAYVHAGAQSLALFEDTVTAMLAGDQAATIRTPVWTLDLKIVRLNFK